MKILDVKIDNLSRKEILEKIEFFLTEEKFHQIVTVNPEFILEAQKNTGFKEIINDASLSVADGIGIRYAFLRHMQFLKARMAGADLMHDILKIANEKNLSIFLAIGKNGLSSQDEIKKALILRYPNIYFYGADIDPDKSWDCWKLEVRNCKILLCNFGAPMQEIFLNKFKNDNIRIAMGVGGSFDFVTGKLKRAPVLIRKTGFEWLWRLIQQPWRIKRIFNAVIKFPFCVIVEKVFNQNKQKRNEQQS